MSPAGWGAMTRAAKRMAPMMNRQNIGNALNALRKIRIPAWVPCYHKTHQLRTTFIDAHGTAWAVFGNLDLDRIWKSRCIT